MKRILYLTFYFEPDLCAGSFRNSPLVKELAEQVGSEAEIDVITTLPNRYSTFAADAPQYEDRGNYKINRIAIPKHQSGMRDQIKSFTRYFSETKRLIDGKKYDLVVASSSRLFTAYLGYTIAKKQRIPLYLDIRDIFTDTMKDVLKSTVVKAAVLPVLNQIERRVFNYAKHINLISGGFKPYFRRYTRPIYSEFPNGIDPEFLNLPISTPSRNTSKTIVYAGNIGEGQGLHIIVPKAAKRLGDRYRFLIIGDGGAKGKLITAIDRLQVNNVELRQPVKRAELLEIYREADFLFLHLNDYDAFKKVLPSKIFELGAYDKPIIAGVAGFANEFIDKNIPNRILFLPGDVDSMVSQLEKYKYENIVRTDFLNNFKRESVNEKMAASIREYL
ncbi:Glycosyltransferase involved in cell wall bisynthesis [Parapedobacter composti]|uniref:Glycosyltransferase involved in cell wall bisynthesis n=1 Tax=Parapedobacter composti TaxID=623281 RepID=A0A1I1IRV6_9SPHI|nr:glycosyltransferase family 4 protein [Parapedobacter composti]SFC39017.1 Glycosyltransferase involved in cell wall bisynthesis [Parapedobacter composti]